MGETNLDLIVYKLDEMSKKQELFETKVTKKLDDVNETVHIVNNLNNAFSEVKEWQQKRDRHIPIKDFIEISDWKKELDQLTSPKQFDKMLTEFEALKTFKTRAMMIYTIVQLGMTAALFWDKLFS